MDSNINEERMEAIVKSAVSHWRSHRDIEDLKQLGRIAYWNENCSEDPDALAVIKVRRRVIDGWRTMNGHRSKYAKHGFAKGLQLEEYMLESSDSSENIVLSNSKDLSQILGISGRTTSIINLLAAGHTKRYIAAQLDIDPSRISQILKIIKDIVSYEDAVKLFDGYGKYGPCSNNTTLNK